MPRQVLYKRGCRAGNTSLARSRFGSFNNLGEAACPLNFLCTIDWLSWQQDMKSKRARQRQRNEATFGFLTTCETSCWIRSSSSKMKSPRSNFWRYCSRRVFKRFLYKWIGIGLAEQFFETGNNKRKKANGKLFKRLSQFDVYSIFLAVGGTRNQEGGFFSRFISVNDEAVIRFKVSIDFYGICRKRKPISINVLALIRRNFVL